ncbi:choline dehydrogenase-like flavoprotein [Rhizobium laguerreae]|jgi:choline dehydrogenase-like flavoprotein|uniref:Choline dehydrogenase-like flavoprotein n=1 Tax=Rhizobium laguerreae TaxID=1076926 RepID=A0ABR6G7I7_9HYPH|nr:choline dehydrogenase-like flavoprotein [Rhizobium laguerreae]
MKLVACCETDRGDGAAEDSGDEFEQACWTRRAARAFGRVRVADSSIFPHVAYANLNGPSIMTGEGG